MIEVLRLTGRCANGAERDKGHIYHAVENGRALCGKEPGRHSAGWSSWPQEGQQITCPKCLRKSKETSVQAKCVGCGAERRIAAGDVPAGDHPCCDKCGMPMIADRAFA